ncbi:MAG: hypothetical protein WDN46_25070 [Methylocella sp.]
MCDPVTIAGIALSGAGAAAKTIGAGQVADATAASLSQNLAAQNALNQEAAGVNSHSLGLYSNLQGQQDAKAKSLGDMFVQDVAPTQANPENEAPGGSANTQANEAAARAVTQGYSNQQALSGAKLRSFGDVLQNDTLAQQQDAAKIGQINNFKQGDTSVLGLELNQDSHAGDGWDLAGSLAEGLGSLGVKGAAAWKLANPGITPPFSPGGIANGFNPFGSARTADTTAPASNPFAIV